MGERGYKLNIKCKAARFVINREGNTSSFNDMLQHLNRHSLEKRGSDVQCVK
jgi:hypothetical protein